MGGKALIYETAMTEGVLYLEVPQATLALSVISFVRYLKGKGITPVLLLGETQDLGILRLVDMLFGLPMLCGERCVKSEMECTAHPPWINRWKDHAKSGMLVFKEMLDRVRAISLLSCITMRIHDPTLAKENRPVPRWAFHVYGNYKAVLGVVSSNR